jgi:hypothetical protein
LPRHSAHKGSSFDDAPEDNPQALFRRWEAFAEDPMFGLFFVDPAVLTIARKYYCRVSARPDLAEAVAGLAKTAERRFGVRLKLPDTAWTLLRIGRNRREAKR